MTFHIITIFPESIKSYFDSSILKRAQEKKLIDVKFYNPRDFTEDKHKRVDGNPFGGGAGMVFKIEPIIKTIKHILKSKSKLKIILFSPAEKQFTQTIARKFAKENGDMLFVCGRYEGVDARLKQILRGLFLKHKLQTTNYKILELSIGPYILTGGELPAAVIVDAISRHIPGVLGKKESLEDEKGVGIPVYTRPEIFEYPPSGGEKYRVPKILLSGNHKKIKEWRKKHLK